VAGVGSLGTTGWENMPVPWNPTSPQAPVSIASTNGSSAPLTLNDVRNGGPYLWDAAHSNLPGDANGDLMDGHCNSTMETPDDYSQVFDMTLSDIPYSVYDVVVYVGANQGQYGSGTAKYVLNGGSEQDFILASGVFTSFTEIVDGVTPGNYIVLKDISGSSFNLQLWGNGANHIGPTGFQIVTYEELANPYADIWTTVTPGDSGTAFLEDFDSDGRNNLYEYALDGDPEDDQDLGVNPTFIKVNDELQYSFKQRNDDLNLIYNVQTCSDLTAGGWTNTGADAASSTPDGLYNNVMHIIPTGSSQSYIRLKITTP